MAVEFEPASPSLFFKNPRSNDPRWGELVRTTGLAQVQKAAPGWVLVGYPDDEGVKRNHGRIGAAEGPDHIRSQLYRFASGVKKAPVLYDLGNLKIENSLEDRRTYVEEQLQSLYSRKHRVLSLGGGHDWAYPDVSAFLKHNAKKKCIVVNIDAHLDVRSDDKGVNSGTSFYRLLENHKNFQLVQIGIQPYATSLFHYEYAKKKKVDIHFFHEALGNLKTIFLNVARQKKPIFLSIDIDGFAASFAPGCSAPSPVGLDGNEFVFHLPVLLNGGNLQGVGIYEVAPKYDRDEQTARFSAAVIQKILMVSGG